MTLGVHAVPAFKQNPTGVEYYAREIITRVCASAGDRPDTSCILYTNIQPTDETAISSPEANPKVRVLRAPALWTQGRLSLEMLLHAPDVLFVPGNALPRILPRRTVLTLHGAEFMQAPGHYELKKARYLAWMTRDGLRRADAVIVPSYATASALVEYFHADERKLHVVHHAVPAKPSIPNGRPEAPKIPYFFYVGRLETHKNVHGLINAFAAFKRSNPEAPHRLVLAGNPGFGYEAIQAAISKSDVAEHIKVVGYVTQEEKWEFLRGAAAFCFPSFAEGFGLPVLEAQAAGTPVLTSNRTALPEVASATGAILINPDDKDAMAQALGRLALDEALRATLIRHGKDNVARFSWKRAAQQTLDILLG